MGLFGNSESELERRVEQLERRVAALERAAFNAGHRVARPSVGEAHESVASEMVRQLALQGNKIAAVKLLRDETGMALREAKHVVDGLA